jgi:hypothetical protein
MAGLGLQVAKGGDDAAVAVVVGARSSLSKMLATCFSTTFVEMNRAAAMAALDRPWAMSESTSRPRGVRAARVSRRLAVSSRGMASTVNEG